MGRPRKAELSPKVSQASNEAYKSYERAKPFRDHFIAKAKIVSKKDGQTLFLEGVRFMEKEGEITLEDFLNQLGVELTVVEETD
jgi:hypothetical protein